MPRRSHRSAPGRAKTTKSRKSRKASRKPTRKSVKSRARPRAPTNKRRPRRSKIGFNLGFGMDKRRPRRYKAQEEVSTIPASYNTIVNNASPVAPESPCVHPDLGLQGIRLRGSQYFAMAQQPNSFGAPEQAYIIDDLTFPGNILQFSGRNSLTAMPVNPINFGGQLAAKAINYQRFRFNRIGLRYNSTCGVGQTGTLAFGYFKDWPMAAQAIGLPVNFGDVADLVPSMATPVNVAQAEYTVPYDGNELYYTGFCTARGDIVNPFPLGDTDAAGSVYGNAENRQQIQGSLFLAADSQAPTDSFTNFGHLYFDYDIELYDPLPQALAEAGTITEIVEVRKLLDYLRKKQATPQPRVLKDLTRATAFDDFIASHPTTAKPCAIHTPCIKLPAKPSNKS